MLVLVWDESLFEFSDLVFGLSILVLVIFEILDVWDVGDGSPYFFDFVIVSCYNLTPVTTYLRIPGTRRSLINLLVPFLIQHGLLRSLLAWSPGLHILLQRRIEKLLFRYLTILRFLVCWWNILINFLRLRFMQICFQLLLLILFPSDVTID